MRCAPTRHTAAFFAVFLAAVASCGPSQGTRVRFEAMGGPIDLVWPSPPAVARVRYLTSISTPADVGASQSLFRRIVNVVTGTAAPRVRQPYGIAVDSAGVIFVADVLQRGVHRFDPVRGAYRFLTARAAGFRSPIGVAVDGAGNAYVSDSELGAVVVIGSDGRERRRFSEGLRRPTGLAWEARRGWLWVVDTEAHQLLAIDREGSAVRRVGARGTAPGEFNYPTNVAVAPDGTIYVSDALNVRIQVFDADGAFLRQFGRHGDGVGDLARPKGVALDSDGHVYVVEGLYDVVNLFDAEGRTLLSVGEAGRGPGEFWLATGIAIDRKDRIYVADSHNNRIQVLQYLRAGEPAGGAR
ncbi:MAG: 6-bladed beta-propeller [Gemmatimonadaceae bacterium]